MMVPTSILTTKRLITIVVLIAAGIGQYANAITPRKNWADSYEANGKCYCDSTFDHGIGDYRVDTPAGRKTVREVCRAIGPGPGRGNNPSYNTIQCGHEPAHEDAIRIGGRLVKDEKECPGRVDRERSSDCQNKSRYKWDLSVFEPTQPTPTPTAAPTPTPFPPVNAGQRCTVIADSRANAESLFASECSLFLLRDCDPITVAGQGKNVCSSQTIENNAAIAISTSGSVIVQAEDYDRAVDSDSGNRGNAYRQWNVDIQPTGDAEGGFNVGWMTAGEWLEYDLYLTEASDVVLNARMASLRNTGMFSVLVDGDVRASNISAPYTNDWQQYETLPVDIGTLSAGYHKLRFEVNNGPFNLNWLRLDGESDGGTPPGTPNIEIQTVISGNSVKVEAIPEIASSNIAQVELYIDGNFVRVERVAPYNWNVTSRTNDTELSNLAPGSHSLRVVVTETSGETSEKTKTFSVN